MDSEFIIGRLETSHFDLHFDWEGRFIFISSCLCKKSTIKNVCTAQQLFHVAQTIQKATFILV